jgi:hypothetical protein
MRQFFTILLAALLTGCTGMEKKSGRAEAQARMVLENSSIENLDRQGVYARLGSPFAVIRIPDGKTGWVYRRGHYKLRGLRYVVVFDDTGTVVDLLYLPYDGGKPLSKTRLQTTDKG